jgi:hypothetical protein
MGFGLFGLLGVLGPVGAKVLLGSAMLHAVARLASAFTKRNFGIRNGVSHF